MALVPFPGAQSGALQIPPDDDDDESGAEDVVSGASRRAPEAHRQRRASAIAVGILVGFAFIDRIFNFLLAPTRKVLPPGVQDDLHRSRAKRSGCTSRSSLIAGVVIASPYVMYQVWMFIAPGLYSNEKKFAVPFVLLHDARIPRAARRSITTSRFRS